MSKQEGKAECIEMEDFQEKTDFLPKTKTKCNCSCEEKNSSAFWTLFCQFFITNFKYFLFLFLSGIFLAVSIYRGEVTEGKLQTFLSIYGNITGIFPTLALPLENTPNIVGSEGVGR
jgi:hypothetical protein